MSTSACCSIHGADSAVFILPDVLEIALVVVRLAVWRWSQNIFDLKCNLAETGYVQRIEASPVQLSNSPGRATYRARRSPTRAIPGRRSASQLTLAPFQA